MKISMTKLGKRYNREWIFRGLNKVLHNGNAYAIIGPNGSGKSTLLQVIAGSTTFSEGTVSYELAGRVVEEDIHYRYISMAAPYLELIEEMTLNEFLSFHTQFKPFSPDYTCQQVIELVGLTRARDKQIRYFSSGMKQRVKLAQALFSDTPVVLLDEPCTNLDAEGIALYRKLVKDLKKDRLFVISSNDPQEYDFCEEKINIADYKVS
jgi:ABC-type multidrug transport system ATPase subunit